MVRLLLALILGLFAAAGPIPHARAEESPAFDEPLDLPAQDTAIELNPVEGAIQYDVEIKSYAQIWATPYKFNLRNSEPIIKVRLSPGRYAIRTVSIDEEGTRGPWSEWSDFEVTYVSPTSIYPPEGGTIQPLSERTEKIRFQWPPMEGASGYKFKLMDAKGQLLREKTTVQPWAVEELALAATYSWSVDFIAEEKGETEAVAAAEGETETQTVRSHEFKIGSPDLGGREVVITAETSATALRYQFELVRIEADEHRSAASIYDQEESEFHARLAPGNYEVRIRTYFQDRSISDWSSPSRFIVTQAPVQPLSPVEGALITPVAENTSVQFEWAPDPAAQMYSLYVFSEKGEVLHKVSSTTPHATLSLKQGMAYSWTVVSALAGQPEADLSQSPDKKSSFAIAPLSTTKLAAVEEPSELYAWGRYYSSIVRYRGENYDLNSQIEQLFNGGTAEAALGYWHRGSNFGLMTNFGVTGLWLPKGFYNYNNAGLHFGYRFIRKGGARLRFWLGASRMEFPEFLESPYTGEWQFKKVVNMGPQIQISYMNEFKRSSKYGYHIYTTVYQGSQGSETPNGLEQVPQISYTVGAFATYRRTENTKWQLGYAYRREAVEYKSTDRLGINNSSTTDGHYLSLSLEWGIGNKN